MELETVIGLETHVQLKTKSKLFCGCDNESDELPPNTNICPICLAHPGTMPVINKQALSMAVRASLMLNCSIHDISHLDRKNYFYPDLPKAYQISQFGLPIGYEGTVRFYSGNEIKEIRVERLHVEEDAAKSQHSPDGSSSYIDFNRGGTPLMEIVTYPDFKSPQDAKLYLQVLRLMMRRLGVTDADMEKGHLRCDANISLRPKGEKKLYPKTEIKNLNSFRSVERALLYEIDRQTKLWNVATPPDTLTTRGWDENTGKTSVQREKEESHDYRYFPEPDLPPLSFQTGTHDHGDTCDEKDSNEIIIECLRSSLPERPTDTVERFISEYDLLLSDAKTLAQDRKLISFTEGTFSEVRSLLKQHPETSFGEETKKKTGKLIGGWRTTEIFKNLKEREINFSDVKMTPHTFAELIVKVITKKITGPLAKEVLSHMVESEAHPKDIIEKHNLSVMSNESEIDSIIQTVIAGNKKAVTEFKNGKEASLKYLIGQVMKASHGKADPQKAGEKLKKRLNRL